MIYLGRPRPPRLSAKIVQENQVDEKTGERNDEKDQEERRKQTRSEEAQRGDQEATGVFAEPADEDGPGGKEVQEVTGGARKSARKVYIRRKDLDIHGYTPGCSGCEAVRRGEQSSGHSKVCRALIERALGETASGENRLRVVETKMVLEELALEGEAAPRASAPEVEAASSKDSPD